MIAPLTLLIVLATTLTVASPLPGPELELAQRFVLHPNNLVPTHGPLKVGAEKMVDFDCIGEAYKKRFILKCTDPSRKDPTTRPSCRRKPQWWPSTNSRSWQTQTRPSSVRQEPLKSSSFNTKQLTDRLKAKNKQGKVFPRHFHFKGESSNIMKDLSNDCKQHQGNTTYLQNPVGSAKHVFKDGAESGPDRVLALAHGKWPKYTKVVYCGLITHRGQDDAKVFRVCHKKKSSKESQSSTASKTSMAQKTSMKTPEASKKPIEE